MSQVRPAEFRFVYFDLGNVLLHFDRDRSCRNAASVLGVEESAIAKILLTDGLGDVSERGELIGRAFVAEICGRLKLKVPPNWESVLDALGDMFTPIAAMTDVPLQVKKQVASIGILSNTCDSHWQWIRRRRYRVLDVQWDTTILSYEVGRMKPDNAIYDVATTTANAVCGCRPNEILFIDDRLENVLAARRHGWTALHAHGTAHSAGRLLQMVGV